MAGALDGRHALVTGGSRGIGRAVADALAAAGARVTILGRDRESLDRAVAEGAAQAAFAADVTDGPALRAAIGQAAERAPIDILVANAGQAVSSPLLRSDAALYRRMLDVNFMGTVEATQAVLQPMTERGFGRIVAVASIAGLKGYPYVSAYCAAKHAVVGFVRALAQEMATTGVTVNAVCPGYTDTDLVTEGIDRIAARTGRSREATLAEFLRHNPQGRLIEPGEVADAVVWLCGESARSVTGQAIAISGGES